MSGKSYFENLCHQLKQLSRCKEFPALLEEWVALDRMDDHKGLQSRCLCGHPIRYCYYVRWKYDLTREIMMGSCCILKFMSNELRAARKALLSKMFTCDVCEMKRKKDLAPEPGVCKGCYAQKCKKCPACGKWFLCQDHKKRHSEKFTCRPCWDKARAEDDWGLD
jgi:hypothetical protein